ncbi:hypothetical protein [Evansella cellulosilytica]|nr:hypothetical protein [Evansella cellulosilytica]
MNKKNEHSSIVFDEAGHMETYHQLMSSYYQYTESIDNGDNVESAEKDH